MALLLIASFFCQHCGGGVAPSIGLSGSARPHRWARFHACRPGYGRAVGPAHVGHMVGVGCTPHLCLGVCCSFISDISPCGRRLTIMAARRAHINFGSCGFVNVPIVKFSSTGGTRCTNRPACRVCAACLACRFSLSAFGYGRGVFASVSGNHIDAPANGGSAPTLACAPEREQADARVIKDWAMYDFYIYASYIFTAFALGAIIAVSFRGLARARQRLAPCRTRKMAMAEKQSPCAAGCPCWRLSVFRTVLCGPVCRRSDAASFRLTGQKVPDFALPDLKPTVRACAAVIWRRAGRLFSMLGKLVRAVPRRAPAFMALARAGVTCSG